MSQCKFPLWQGHRFQHRITGQTLLSVSSLYPSVPSCLVLPASHRLPSLCSPPLILQTQGLRFSGLPLTPPPLFLMNQALPPWPPWPLLPLQTLTFQDHLQGSNDLQSPVPLREALVSWNVGTRCVHETKANFCRLHWGNRSREEKGFAPKSSGVTLRSPSRAPKAQAHRHARHHWPSCHRAPSPPSSLPPFPTTHPGFSTLGLPLSTLDLLLPLTMHMFCPPCSQPHLSVWRQQDTSPRPPISTRQHTHTGPTDNTRNSPPQPASPPPTQCPHQNSGYHS